MRTSAILAQLAKPTTVPELKPEQKDDEVDSDYVTFHYAEEPEAEQYFSSFTQNQIDELINKYKDILHVKNRDDLEKLIANNEKNKKIAESFRIILWIANALNFGYIAFVATTGVQGLQSAISIFSNFIVPALVGYLIGAPLGLFDVLSYMLFFSPQKESVLSTLEFLAFRTKPFHERRRELYEWIKKSPLKAIARGLFESSLAISSTFAMMTVLLGFVHLLPFGATIFLSTFTTLFGYIYMQKYVLGSARQGLSELLSTLSALLQKTFCERELSKSFQVIAQSGATISLLTYPINYYVGAKTALAFGLSQEAADAFAITSSITSLSINLNVYFPLTFKHYFKQDSDLQALIAKEETSALPEMKENKFRLLLQKLNFTDEELDALPANPSQKLKAIIKKLEADVVKKRGYWSLMKQEPLGVLQSLFCLGVSIGQTVLTVMDPSLAAILYLGSSFLPFITGVKATIARQTTLAACEEIKKLTPSEIKSIPLDRKTTCRDRSLNFLAMLFTGSLAVCDLLNAMGSAPDLSNDFKLFYFIFAFYRMLGGLYFNYPKMHATLHAWGSPQSTKESKTHSPKHFKPANPANSENKEILDISAVKRIQYT